VTNIYRLFTATIRNLSCQSVSFEFAEARSYFDDTRSAHLKHVDSMTPMESTWVWEISMRKNMFTLCCVIINVDYRVDHFVAIIRLRRIVRKCVCEYFVSVSGCHNNFARRNSTVR